MEQTRQVEPSQQCFTSVEQVYSGSIQTQLHKTQPNGQQQRSHTPCGKEQGVLEMGGMQSPKQFYVMNGVTPSCVRPPHTATQRKIIMNPQQENRQPSQSTQFQSQGGHHPSIKVHEVHHVKVVDHREEIEAWRSKYSHLERQYVELQQELAHYKQMPPQERITYVEDTQRSVELERRLITYQNEVERLTILVREGGYEQDQWRQANTQLQLQLQQKQGLEHEIDRNKKVYLENEQFLQNELQHVTSALQQAHAQLQGMQTTLVDSKTWEGRYQQQLRECQTLANEVESLNKLLCAKSDEFHQEKAKLHQELNIRIDQFRELEQIKSKEQVHYQQAMRQANIDWEERLSQEVRYRNEEVNRLTSITQTLQLALQDTTKYEEYEARSKSQGDELNRCNSQLRHLKDDNDKLRQNITFIQQELEETQGYIQYEEKYQGLSQEYERLSSSLKTKHEENEHLRTCISKLQITLNDNSKLQDYENKIALLTQEIERLHQSLKSRTDELDKTRISLAQLQGEFQQIDNFQIEVSRLNNLVRVKNEEIERLKQQCLQFQYQLQDLSRYKDTESKVQLLSTEIERLTVQLRNKNDELERSKMQINQMAFDTAKYKDLESKNMSYCTEIERLNNVLKNKLGELESLRSTCNKLEQGSQNSKQDAEQKVHILAQELKTLDGRFKDCQHRVILISTENERLTNILRSQMDEIQHLRMIGQQSEGWNMERDRLNATIYQLTQESESWKQQFITLNKEYHLNQQDFRGSDGRLKECQNKLILVSTENERLNNTLRCQMDELQHLRSLAQQSEGWSMEKESLYESITSIQQELDSWKQQFIILNREYHKNQELLILTSAELEFIKVKKSNSREGFDFNNQTISTIVSQSTIENKSHQERKSQPPGFQQYTISALTHKIV